MKTPALSITPSFDGTEVSIPPSAIEYRDNIIGSTSVIVAVSGQDELEAAATALRDLSIAVKSAEDTRKQVKAPFIAFGKKIDATHEEFVSPLEKEKARVTAMINTYQRAEFERHQAQARRLADEQRKAQEAQWLAEAEIKRKREELERMQRELESKKLSDANRAKLEAQQKEAEAAKQKAELAAEEAYLTNQSAASQLTAPANTPKGLTTKVSFDFEIVNDRKFFAKHRDIWVTWNAGEETWKIDRAGLKKALNAESHPWQPPDGTQSVVMSESGIRVFVNVSSHTRA